MAHLLVVDDDRMILNLVEAALRKAGYTVTTASDGLTALEKIGAETFDLLLTDWNMPGGVSGVNLLQTIRKDPRFENLPAMFLTGRRDKADVQKALQLGVDDYLVKPVDYDLLLAKVEALLEKAPGGTHSFKETPISELASMKLSLEIKGISEQGLTLNSPLPFIPNSKIQLETELFEKIGIANPQLRVGSCELTQQKPPIHTVRVLLIGLTQREQQDLRMFIQKNDPRKAKNAS